ALPLPAADKRLSLYRPGAAGNAAPSPLLLVLEEELKRNVAALSAEKTTAPYFVQYEAIDDHAVTIEASFGALVSSSDERSRSLDADVRVGTRKLDNTHRLRGDYDVSRDFTRASYLPVEDDPGPI